MINKKRLISLTQQLIRINSENPPGNEKKIAGFVRGYLKGLGMKTEIYEFQKDRQNIIAVREGRDKKHSLLITPHLDTVPAGKSWKVPPFAGKILKNRIYGLGATDCKCNLACAMEVIKSITEDKVSLGYNLIFAATADEETGSELGLIPLLKKKILVPSAAVVLDSDDFDIVVSQKGLMHLKVKLRGIRAHGAYPWRGLNAIDVAVNILKELKERKRIHPKHKYLRPPTVNIGTIRGGDKVNIVADWCEFELDFRFLPGMSARLLLSELKSIIRRHANRFEVQIQGIQQPYSIEETHSLVRVLSKAMREVKIKPHIVGSEGATVITFFQHEGVPAVATGFGSGGCAHTADEYVKIDNLYRGAQALEDFLKDYNFCLTPNLVG